MKYIQVPNEPNVVIWQDDDGSSGVIRATDADAPTNTGPSFGGQRSGHRWDAYLLWRAAGNEPQSMIPIDSRTLDELRISALAAINTAADTALEPITSQYPRTEIDSWPEQCSESRAWLASSSAHTPLLNAISGGLDDAGKEQLCLGILGKADAYKTAVGAVIAWRRALTSWVEAQENRELLISFVPLFPEVPHD